MTTAVDHKRMFLVIGCWMLIGAYSVADGILKTSESERMARLTAIDSGVGYVFALNEDLSVQERVSADRFVRWGEPVPRPLKPFLLLTDGTEIILDRQEDLRRFVNDLLDFRSDTFGNVLISIDSVRAIILQSPPVSAQRDELTRRLIRNGGLEDELILASGDVLRGRLDSMNGEFVVFVTNGRQRQIARDLIALVTLDPRFARRRTRPAHAIIGLRDGNRLLAESVDADNDHMQIELFDGTILTAASYVRPIEDQIVSFVQPLGEHVRYLSELVPSNYKSIPFLSGTWPYGLDRDIHGRTLVAAKSRSRAAKGIALHSTSRLTFDLPAGFRQFEAELGLAAHEASSVPGSVVYRVFLRSEANDWREAYKSPVVRSSTDLIDCRVPLSAGAGIATEISLVVDFADRAGQGDHALWLDARLVR